MNLVYVKLIHRMKTELFVSFLMKTMCFNIPKFISASIPRLPCERVGTFWESSKPSKLFDVIPNLNLATDGY